MLGPSNVQCSVRHTKHTAGNPELAPVASSCRMAALTAAQLVVRVARVQMRQDPLHSRVIQLQGCPGFCFGLDLGACNVGLRGCLGLSLGTGPPHHRGLRDRRSWTLHGRAALLRQRTGFMLKLRRRWV